MATQQEQPAQPAPVRKYETFVAQQLARASGRVRGLDLAAAGLVLLLGTLLYALGVGAADLCFNLSPGVRLTALAAYGVLIVLYLGSLLTLFLRRRINPYYAARQLEKSLSDAKGSVTNWLDLHDRPLPPAIRATLGARAARDLGRADVEEAISGRRNLFLLALLGGVLLGLAILFLSGPGRFASLLTRAFAPFAERSLPTETEILLLQPEGGDLTVPVNHRVAFRVQVTGRVPRVNQPDAVRLLYRYNRTDAYAAQPLELDASDEWTLVFLPDQVQNGFWYRLAAGDAETPEHQVRVRSIPQVVRFDVAYHYRPYLHLPDRSEHYPNARAVFPQIKDYRGTAVTLTLKTNRTLKHGKLVLDLPDGPQEVPGEVLAQDKETLRLRLVLEHSGTFRALFVAQDGEANSDRSPYPLDVIDDRAPVVVLDQPGKDVSLPATGTLRLAGSATDDLGIKRLVLRLRVSKGEPRPALEAKGYRPGKSFELAGGRYPDRLAYTDFVALDRLKTDKGTAWPLAAGTEVEYWLEAVDNCDYPDPSGNVGRSKKYKVAIGPPDQDQQKQQQQRTQAEQQQQQQEQKQDQDLTQQNEKAEADQRKQEEAGGAKRAEQQPPREPQDKKPGNTAASEQQQHSEKRGEAKGAGPSRSAAKGKGPPHAEAGKQDRKQPPSGQKEASVPKGEGQGAPRQEQIQAKDAGTAGEQEQRPSRGAARGSGQEQPRPQAKGGDQAGANASAHSKPGPTQPQEAKAGDAKNGGEQPTAAAHARGGEQPTPAQTKGQEPAPPRAVAREADPASAQQAAALKPGATSGPASQSRLTMKANEAPQRQPGTAKSGSDQERKGDADAVARREQQQREQQAHAFLKELQRLAKDGPDPQVREAARKALDEARQGAPAPSQAKEQQGQATPGEARDAGNPDKAQRSQPGKARGGPAGQQAQAGTPKGPGQGQRGKDETAQQQPGKEPSAEGTGGGQRASTKDDAPPGSRSDPNFARRPGELHLADLKKTLTPEALKKLNWTPKQIEQFLREARAYEQWLHGQGTKDSKDKLSGGPSQLAGSGARLVGPGAQQLNDPLDTLHVVPPPEFRDALRRFSSSTPPTGPNNKQGR